MGKEFGAEVFEHLPGVRLAVVCDYGALGIAGGEPFTAHAGRNRNVPREIRTQRQSSQLDGLDGHRRAISQMSHFLLGEA